MWIKIMDGIKIQLPQIKHVLNDDTLEILKKQQEMMSSIKPLLITFDTFAKEINQIVPDLFSNLSKSLNSISQAIRPLYSEEFLESVRSITTSAFSTCENMNIIHDIIGTRITEIQKNLSTLKLNNIDWVTLNKWIDDDIDDGLIKPTEQNIKEITYEILEDSGVLQAQGDLEEKLNILIQKVDKNSQPWYKAVFLSIIATLIMVVLNPLIEPLQREYTELVQQNSRKIIKQIQGEVYKEYGDEPIIRDYKIVSTNEMTVRATNARKSNAVGKVFFGQLVRVVKKNRNWTLIMYENYEGEIIEGWVFTRYLSEITY